MNFVNKYEGIEYSDLFNGELAGCLFQYSEEEYDLFTKGYSNSRNKQLMNNISKALNREKNTQKSSRIEELIHFINSLNDTDLSVFENYAKEYKNSKPNYLWEMLHKDDHTLYKNSKAFYGWLGTLSDDMLDYYIFRAADKKRLHSNFVYETKKSEGTTVEILDGYIAVSSSNLEALDRFKDRVLSTNNCEFEHRIKKHGKVTIHSYIFNMNKQNSN